MAKGVESEARAKIEAGKIVHGNENENETPTSNEREGWKVMGFGLAWFWLLTSST